MVPFLVVGHMIWYVFCFPDDLLEGVSVVFEETPWVSATVTGVRVLFNDPTSGSFGKPLQKNLFLVASKPYIVTRWGCTDSKCTVVIYPASYVIADFIVPLIFAAQYECNRRMIISHICCFFIPLLIGILDCSMMLTIVP